MVTRNLVARLTESLYGVNAYRIGDPTPVVWAHFHIRRIWSESAADAFLAEINSVRERYGRIPAYTR